MSIVTSSTLKTLNGIQRNPSGKARDHCSDVIMGAMASQITSLMIAYSTVYSGANQRKHQGSASLVFVWGNHRSPVNSTHKWPVTRKNVSIWWHHHMSRLSLQNLVHFHAPFFTNDVYFTPHDRPPLLEGHHLGWPFHFIWRKVRYFAISSGSYQWSVITRIRYTWRLPLRRQSIVLNYDDMIGWHIYMYH